MDDTLLQSVQTQFNKLELNKVAQHLNLDVDGLSKQAIIEAIVADLEANGVPEAQDSTPILDEMLLVLGIIDEEGNIISTEGGDVQDEVMPPCFSYADDRDPACKICKVFRLCMDKRMVTRPPCFGQAFDAEAEECQMCLEAHACKLVILSMKAKEK